MTQTYVILDFETTGLDHHAEQVIEIAALKVAEDGREIGRFQTFVELACGRDLPEFITNLTGITPEMLVGAPSEKCALEALTWFAYDSTIIAQNAPFDLSFATRLETEHDGGTAIEDFICTRAMSRLIEPNESASLKDVCARHGIALTGHHRAMNDVLATFEVFKMRREQAEAAGIEYVNVVVDSPDRPISDEFREWFPEATVVTMERPQAKKNEEVSV